METLYTLAEVAIAMTGFSAIVVMFRRQDDEYWARRDADRFHGMLIHSLVGLTFCFLPFLFAQFMDQTEALRGCSALLALATAGQATIAYRLESRSGALVRFQITAFGTIVVTLTLLNAFWLSARLVSGIYLVSVFWHVLQAAILFIMLIWIPSSRIEEYKT